MINVNVSLVNLQKEFDIALGDILEAVDKNLEEVADTIFQSAKTTPAFNDKTGSLRRSIRIKKSKYNDNGYIVAATGRNRGKGGGVGYHAHFIEFGHVLIAWGRVTGKRVAARPFMRPAKEVGVRRAIELFRQK